MTGPLANPLGEVRPVATYRLQLREGVTFAEAARRIGPLAAMGVSHLYLSPIQAAAPGSTHGYDVIDPTIIEPALGGREGFAALSRAARAAGLGIILDIVPNHTAFRLENPWLRDVLRHGERSGFARHFDIDWGAGRLVLPFLSAPFEQLLDGGQVRAAEGPEGPVLAVEGLEVPLTPHPLSEAERAGDPASLRDLHARQAWRLAHWEMERDGITHRRFFNVTGLIGMRVEDSQVFADTHALILDLVRAGEVQALRVDHVDGLAEPGAYLQRLREAVGDLPLWVEKILMGPERLRPWPVAGTTGYEAGAAIARVLTDEGGLGRLDALWRQETEEARSWPEVLREAKGEVIRQDLAAELRQLRDLARAAADASPEIEAGEEALREAVLALLVEVPRYRTYLEEDDPDDLRLLDEAAARAEAGLVSPTAIRFLAGALRDPTTDAGLAFRQRFQQVTGALMAKAQEDTAFFRFTRCLAHCEVGADPGEPHWTPAQFGEWLGARAGGDLTLTSSHDTKRAEDARMRLVALTHLPDAFARAWEAAGEVEGAEAVPPALRWYVVQSLLAIWEEGRGDIADRLATHVEKAMREAREVTTWSHPKEAAEARAEDWARALARAWADGLPPGVAPLIARAEDLSLTQLALKAMMPGVPDFYQGAEGPLHHLTDPDNRLGVDWAAVEGAEAGFARRKARLTRALLRLRAEQPGFFATAAARVARREGGGWSLLREGAEGRLEVRIGSRGEGPADALALWPEGEAAPGGILAVAWTPAGLARAAE